MQAPGLKVSTFSRFSSHFFQRLAVMLFAVFFFFLSQQLMNIAYLGPLDRVPLLGMNGLSWFFTLLRSLFRGSKFVKISTPWVQVFEVDLAIEVPSEFDDFGRTVGGKLCGLDIWWSKKFGWDVMFGHVFKSVLVPSISMTHGFLQITF